MRAALAVAAIAAVCGVARADTPAAAGTNAAAGQQRFAAATALEAKGDFVAAAAALETLGHEMPPGSFAPDALFEAAVVAEERLSDPARARRLYAEVASRFAASRLARRAAARAAELGVSLSTGEAPLREYDAIIASSTSRPRAEAITRMSALLAAHPDFALADRALFWLGQRLAEERRPAEAMARFAEAERRFPASEWALRAKKARADLLLSRGHVLVARGLYRALVATADPVARSAGREGLADSVSFVVRAIFVVLSVLYLVGFATLQLRAVSPRARLRRIPIELTYYAPVAALFVIAALTENRAIGLATTGIAVGGAVVVWLTSLGWSSRLDRGPMSAAARAGRIAAVTLAVFALVFLAVQATGLTDIVLETFRSGPERG